MSSYFFDLQEDLAQRFLDSCDETFKLIASHPQLGAPNKFSVQKLSSVRMVRVRGFEKYLIFYIPTDNEIRILHVFHSAKDYNRVFDEDIA
ncbi:MAG: type II toxin-antitoxin system RelE/ParE family toxin [Acidobacteria bacterium]|nr:type II toxin-antitoxin system RelE/ParE family toxin [Acidobacteriota bacterium]